MKIYYDIMLQKAIQSKAAELLGQGGINTVCIRK